MLACLNSEQRKVLFNYYANSRSKIKSHADLDMGIPHILLRIAGLALGFAGLANEFESTIDSCLTAIEAARMAINHAVVNKASGAGAVDLVNGLRFVFAAVGAAALPTTGWLERNDVALHGLGSFGACHNSFPQNLMVNLFRGLDGAA
jgi:hypothetical protein